MAAKVIWAPSSLSDLAEITEFIAADNMSAAIKVGTAIVEAVERLAGFPRLGHPLRDPDRPGLRETVVDRYRIVYRLQDEDRTVIVLRIWHGARGAPELPSTS